MNTTTTRSKAIHDAGGVFAATLRARESMTPRELAEASWTPTSRHSVDELEDLIRAERGLHPRARSA